MHFYKHDIGQFALMTSGLDCEEVGIFVRLLDRYLLTEKPIKTEWVNLGFKGETQEKAKAVLCGLFVEKDGGWVYEPGEEMLAEYQKSAEKSRENGKKGGRPRKVVAKVNEQNLDETEWVSEKTEWVCTENPNETEPQPKKTLINNYELETNNNKKNRTKKVSVVKPDEVTEQVWEDFCVIRKEKKAPLTKTALDLIKAEAEKAGIGLNEALSISCSRGWQSFKAEWMRGSQTRNDGFGAPSIEQPRPKSYEPDWDKIDYGETRPLSEC